MKSREKRTRILLWMLFYMIGLPMVIYWLFGGQPPLIGCANK